MARVHCVRRDVRRLGLFCTHSHGRRIRRFSTVNVGEYVGGCVDKKHLLSCVCEDSAAAKVVSSRVAYDLKHFFLQAYCLAYNKESAAISE